MRKTVIQFWVAAALALGMLLSVELAVADKIQVVSAMQRNEIFEFELACLDNRYVPIDDISMVPLDWRVSVEGFEPLTVTNVRVNENVGIHYIVIAQSCVNINKSSRKDMTEAVQLLIDGMRPSDRMTLYRLNTNIEMMAQFTSDKTQLTAATEQLINVGKQSGQALYAALETALRCGLENKDSVGKTALIVFSDGYNTGKDVLMSTADVTPLIGQGGIRIFTVLLQTTSTSDPAFLQAISEQANGFLSRQKETDATDAVATIRDAIQKTVIVTVESQNNAYNGLTEDAWRILYTPNGMVTLRTGYTMPIMPWVVATIVDPGTAANDSEAPAQTQPIVEFTADDSSETIPPVTANAKVVETASTAAEEADTNGTQALIASATVAEPSPASDEAQIGADEEDGDALDHTPAMTVAIIAAVLLVTALLILWLHSLKEKRQAEERAMLETHRQPSGNVPVPTHVDFPPFPVPIGDANQTAPEVRRIPQLRVAESSASAQLEATNAQAPAILLTRSDRLYPQNAGVQTPGSESSVDAAPNRTASGHRWSVPLDQTFAEMSSPSPLDQTFAETPSPSSLDQTFAEIPLSSYLDQTVAEISSPSPLDQTFAEIPQPTPMDVTVDEKAFGMPKSAKAVAVGAAMPADSLEQTVEGRPEESRTLESTYVAPTYRQTTLLLTIREADSERVLQVPLDMGRTVWFGRDGDFLLNPNDQSISRRHFSITLTPSELRLKDNSPNGTGVDGHWIYKEERTLGAGSVITVGGEDQKPCEPTEIVITDIRGPGDGKTLKPTR